MKRLAVFVYNWFPVLGLLFALLVASIMTFVVNIPFARDYPGDKYDQVVIQRDGTFQSYENPHSTGELVYFIIPENEYDNFYRYMLSTAVLTANGICPDPEEHPMFYEIWAATKEKERHGC